MVKASAKQIEADRIDLERRRSYVPSPPSSRESYLEMTRSAHAVYLESVANGKPIALTRFLSMFPRLLSSDLELIIDHGQDDMRAMGRHFKKLMKEGRSVVSAVHEMNRLRFLANFDDWKEVQRLTIAAYPDPSIWKDLPEYPVD